MGSGGRSCSDRVNWFFKFLFGTVAVVGLFLVLLVATLDMTSGDRGTTKTTATSATPDQLVGNSMKHADHGAAVLGRDDQKVVHPEFDLNYMSKRRVPNGPDPIHNRRAGNSGRPPGQS